MTRTEGRRELRVLINYPPPPTPMTRLPVPDLAGREDLPPPYFIAIEMPQLELEPLPPNYYQVQRTSVIEATPECPPAQDEPSPLVLNPTSLQRNQLLNSSLLSSQSEFWLSLRAGPGVQGQHCIEVWGNRNDFRLTTSFHVEINRQSNNSITATVSFCDKLGRTLICCIISQAGAQAQTVTVGDQPVGQVECKRSGSYLATSMEGDVLFETLNSGPLAKFVKSGISLGIGRAIMNDDLAEMNLKLREPTAIDPVTKALMLVVAYKLYLRSLSDTQMFPGMEMRSVGPESGNNKSLFRITPWCCSFYVVLLSGLGLFLCTLWITTYSDTRG